MIPLFLRQQQDFTFTLSWRLHISFSVDGFREVTLLNRLYGEWTHPCLYLFSTWEHTIFSCLWTVLLFLTWLYTRFWLYVLQKHPYCEKHSLSLQTRSAIRFATIYDRLSLTHESRMTILSSTLNRIESRRFMKCRTRYLDEKMTSYPLALHFLQLRI